MRLANLQSAPDGFLRSMFSDTFWQIGVTT